MRMIWSGLLVCLMLGVAALAQSTRLPGDPLPGLTPTEFELFRLGREDFTEVESAEEGLGPAFNGTSCAVCHNMPAIGGTGIIAEVRGGYRDESGEFTAVGGGTLYHLFSIPGHSCQPRIPEEVNVMARRIAIPLFGAGLVEAIPDETILAGEDPVDRNRDGATGRAARIVDRATGEPRIGRFGWKAQHATLLSFGADAYLNEMGITNDLFRAEEVVGIGAVELRRCGAGTALEDKRDLRTGLRGIDQFENFMKFLAPLDRRPADDAAREGERVFQEVGCAACHVPVMATGPSAHPAFNRRPVPLFSDLLLHDVATGDGVPQEAAAANEIRTPALWGLRFRRALLHDGSAATPDEAIRRHGGEALAVRQRFERLSVELRAKLFRFLSTI